MARAPTKRTRAILDRSAIDAAIAKSAFKDLPAETLRDLVEGTRLVRLASKEYFFRQNDLSPCGLIVKGFVRAGYIHPDGRVLTVSWEYPGAILGLIGALHPPSPLEIEAVTDTTLLELSVPVMRAITLADPKVAWAVTGLAITFFKRSLDEIFTFAGRSAQPHRVAALGARVPDSTGHPARCRGHAGRARGGGRCGTAVGLPDPQDVGCRGIGPGDVRRDPGPQAAGARTAPASPDR